MPGHEVPWEPRDLVYRIIANRAVLNRGPWQRDLTVIRSQRPFVQIGIPALANSFFEIDAPSAESSLHLDASNRIARLSTIFVQPEILLGIISFPITARTLEVHLRETPGRSSEPWSPTLPERAQVVLAGQGVRIGAGTPLGLAADLHVTGGARLVDYAHWAGQGSVLVRGLTLGDATGEVLRLDATLVVSSGVPHASGTVLTVCPLSVRAAFAAAPRVSEQRLRLPVKLSLNGTPGAWTLGGLPDAPRAVRAQQPPCPALR